MFSEGGADSRIAAAGELAPVMPVRDIVHFCRLLYLTSFAGVTKQLLHGTYMILSAGVLQEAQLSPEWHAPSVSTSNKQL